MLSKALAKQALDDAFRAHFAKVFIILMGESTNEEQWKRTARGLRNAVAAYDRIDKVIDEWDRSRK